MKAPDEVFSSIVATLLLIWQSNAGGFVFVSLAFLVVAWLLVRSNARHQKRQQDQIDALAGELRECNAKHAASDLQTAALHTQMGNMRMSISALFTYAILSGDRRLTDITMPDLLEGKFALKVVNPQTEDRRESPSITPT